MRPHRNAVFGMVFSMSQIVDARCFLAFWLFLLNLKLLKIDQNWFNPIEEANDISKITFSVIVYACCLN